MKFLGQGFRNRTYRHTDETEGIRPILQQHSAVKINFTFAHLQATKGVTLSKNFRRKGASPTNHCRCQKTKVIALLCHIKISAVHCLVLSQSTRVTDGRTDRRTDRITTANTALAYSCSRGINYRFGSGTRGQTAGFNPFTADPIKALHFAILV